MAEPATFTVHVDGAGTFVFLRRTMRAELSVAAEFSRLIEGVATPTPFLEQTAGILATLKVLTKSSPDGWDPEALDPLDQDSYSTLLKVHGALRAREAEFRANKAKPNP